MQNNDFVMTFYTYMSLYWSYSRLHYSPSSLSLLTAFFPMDHSSVAGLSTFISHAFTYTHVHAQALVYHVTHVHIHTFMCILSFTISHMYTYTHSCICCRSLCHMCMHTHTCMHMLSHTYTL